MDEFFEESDLDSDDSKNKTDFVNLGTGKVYNREQSSFLLEPGSTFEGTQKGEHTKPSAVWKVKVIVEHADFEKAIVCGSMIASNVPKAKEYIETYWEAEIVDIANFSFRTRRWGASLDTDLKHWNAFPGFKPFSQSFIRNTISYTDLVSSEYIFLRLKEKLFLKNDDDANLTIQGFYYMCLNTTTKRLMGYYYDPLATPFQKLDLIWKDKTSFACYSFR